MKLFSIFLAVIFFSVIAFSCSKSSSGGGSTACTLSTDSYTAPTSGTVTYAATRTGTASLNSLTYKNASGLDTVVNNPTLPYVVNFPVQSGGVIHIEATGNAPAGDTLEIVYSYSGAGFATQNADDCGH